MAVGEPVFVDFAIGVAVAMSVAQAVAQAVSFAQSVAVSVGHSVAMTVGHSVSLQRLAGFVALVGSLVEVGEEAEEEYSMTTDPPNKRLGIVAVDKEQLEGVHHNGDELDHLESGEVFLPPDVLLVLGSHGGHHVVEVHDDVNERVEQSEESRVAAGRETDAEPHAHRHDPVVHHVQKRYVLLFFTQNKENRVEKFGELGEVIPPASVDHPHGNGIVTIVNRLTIIIVVVEPSAHQALVEEPGAEDDLNEVVDDEQPPELIGGTILHEVRSPHLDDHHVTQTDGHRRQRRAHKQPILHSRISKLPDFVVSTDDRFHYGRHFRRRRSMDVGNYNTAETVMKAGANS